MLNTEGITLAYGSRKLFENVNLSLAPENCYGLIGANGSGKSTFLKILSGEVEPSHGTVSVTPGYRISVLQQDHFQFDEYPVLTTILMGHKKLYEVMLAKDAVYAKPDFSEADGVRASELETEFAELNGWEAEAEAAKLLSELGIAEEFHSRKMKDLDGSQKVRVLLAQALFGMPDILLLDEPTNHLDIETTLWLEEFLYEFKNTVVVVSHDRHFLDRVCTHILDIDFGRIQLYTGNWSFWYESSQLILRQKTDQNKQIEEKRKELQTFIMRFSNNASKSRQATARKKLLEKLTLEDIKPSSRRTPYIFFKAAREAGNDILTAEDLSKAVEGETLFRNASFRVDKGEKIAFVSKNTTSITALFRILMKEAIPDGGAFKWGASTGRAYFPKDNASFFDCDLNLIDWLRQYSAEKDENFIRGFLGKMLFSGDETLKKANVLSGGEKVRCLFSRMMLLEANVLLFDEPTNHLDLEAITALNDGLIAFRGTILFTSHDHQFVQTVANRIIEITPNGLIDKQNTTYDEYLADPHVRERRRELYPAGKS
ncbi:MAG TPA: ATP-binding cassette domain-containing protein [Candidatus Omnitrophota bacterium]|nr:ATP-binding cassette domain-containing protein [Candidatus Omnitrophota bacterium]